MTARTVLPRVPSIRGVAATAAVCVLGCMAWALWPLPAVQSLSVPIERGTVERQARPPEPLDLAAFGAPLWVAPPPPPQVAAPPPPPPPLRLQLIAIVRDGEAFKAAVYDPDADRILVVAVGDSIAGRTVEQVRSADVTVRDGTRSRLLSLRTDGVSP